MERLRRDAEARAEAQQHQQARAAAPSGRPSFLFIYHILSMLSHSRALTYERDPISNVPPLSVGFHTILTVLFSAQALASKLSQEKQERGELERQQLAELRRLQADKQAREKEEEARRAELERLAGEQRALEDREAQRQIEIKVQPTLTRVIADAHARAQAGRDEVLGQFAVLHAVRQVLERAAPCSTRPCHCTASLCGRMMQVAGQDHGACRDYGACVLGTLPCI